MERIRVDAEFASLVAEQLGLAGGAALRTVDEIIDNDEDFAVEFKSTARWDLREDKPNKAMEDAVVKTVAGFLNTDGGTLLIGVGPDRRSSASTTTTRECKPPNGDGFVNWLTTHLINAVGHAAVMRSRARIAVHDGHEICRLDVARSPAAGVGQDQQGRPRLLRPDEQLDTGTAWNVSWTVTSSTTGEWTKGK